MESFRTIICKNRAVYSRTALLKSRNLPYDFAGQSNTYGV